jgi:hypothetical protein
MQKNDATFLHVAVKRVGQNNWQENRNTSQPVWNKQAQAGSHRAQHC